jgi:hypothetical protein
VDVEVDDVAFDDWALQRFANWATPLEAVLSKIDRAALSLDMLEAATWCEFMLCSGTDWIAAGSGMAGSSTPCATSFTGWS